MAKKSNSSQTEEIPFDVFPDEAAEEPTTATAPEPPPKESKTLQDVVGLNVDMSSLSLDNRQKLASALEHLCKMFHDAQCEQIGGRRFWGYVEIHVPFEGGVASEVSASRFARDKVQRIGRNELNR